MASGIRSVGRSPDSGTLFRVGGAEMAYAVRKDKAAAVGKNFVKTFTILTIKALALKGAMLFQDCDSVDSPFTECNLMRAPKRSLSS